MELGCEWYLENWNSCSKNLFRPSIKNSFTGSHVATPKSVNYAMPPCNLSKPLIRTSNKLPISSLRLTTRIDLKAFPCGRFDFVILPSSSSSLVSNAVGFSTSSMTIGSNPERTYSAVPEGQLNASEKEFLSIEMHFKLGI